MPASRRKPCGRCSSDSAADPARTIKLNPSTRPAITASGRPKLGRGLLRAGTAPAGCSTAGAAAAPATSTTGRTGRMHGEMAARNPATTPTTTSSTMALLVLPPAPAQPWMLRKPGGHRVTAPGRWERGLPDPGAFPLPDPRHTDAPAGARLHMHYSEPHR